MRHVFSCLNEKNLDRTDEAFMSGIKMSKPVACAALLVTSQSIIVLADCIKMNLRENYTMPVAWNTS